MNMSTCSRLFPTETPRGECIVVKIRTYNQKVQVASLQVHYASVEHIDVVSSGIIVRLYLRRMMNLCAY